jgi:hypothetical protein
MSQAPRQPHMNSSLNTTRGGAGVMQELLQARAVYLLTETPVMRYDGTNGLTVGLYESLRISHQFVKN